MIDFIPDPRVYDYTTIQVVNDLVKQLIAIGYVRDSLNIVKEDVTAIAIIEVLSYYLVKGDFELLMGELYEKDSDGNTSNVIQFPTGE